MISIENRTFICTVVKCQWSERVCKLSKFTVSEQNCAIYCCFHPPVVQICIYSSHSIVEIQFLLYRYFYQYFVGILPKTRYFLLAFYWYFRETLDSVIFLRPRWQPCLVSIHKTIRLYNLSRVGESPCNWINEGEIINETFRCEACTVACTKKKMELCLALLGALEG